MKTDTQVQREVLEALAADGRVEETDVGVEVDHGLVTLTGTVDSHAKKLAAQEAVHRVYGVLDVANDILVRAPGHHSHSDPDIARAARGALERLSSLPNERISITVADGWVTLSGRVDHVAQRDDAGSAAQRLTGVRGVINEIMIVTPRIDPAHIRAAIEQVLERRAEREAERIDVSVYDGAVMLKGRVHSWAEKRAIIGAVSHAPGVEVVKDDLHIDPLA